jgi:hypothetical protein
MRGVPLNHLVGQYFRMGDCVLYGGRLNVPCLYLENLLAKKVFKALLNSRHNAGKAGLSVSWFRCPGCCSHSGPSFGRVQPWRYPRE